MKYRVEKPLQYFQVGQTVEVDPSKPNNARLIGNGTLVSLQKKPKAEKRETKVVEPSEVKDDVSDE